jgi:transcriptional regulator with XRE-family HTH domain
VYYRAVVTGRELRKLRRRLGWTQQEMAKALGLAHRGSIAKFESGARRIDKVMAIAVRCLALHRGQR